MPGMKDSRPSTLKKLRVAVGKELRDLERRVPFASANVIGYTLEEIREGFGEAEVDRVIDDYNMESKGWHKYRPVEVTNEDHQV